MTLYNHFLFLILPLLWNAVFYTKIPMGHFQGDAPKWIIVPENILRIAAFTYPLWMPIDPSTPHFRLGLTLYLTGLVAYLGSWTILMKYPHSHLSQKTGIRFAPAFTPLVWMVGMAIMANSRIYLFIATGFIALHVLEYVFRYQK